MSDLLVAWLISLPPVFLVGWAWGRSSRRPVIVNFPELRPIDAIKPTQAEVLAALRATGPAVVLNDPERRP